VISSALLNEDLPLEPYEGESGHNTHIYGTPVSVRARFVGKRRLVRKSDGQEIISSGTVLLRPDIVCPLKSRITRAGRAYEVVEVLPISELNRAHHQEVLVS
jgi:hypothetical protein